MKINRIYDIDKPYWCITIEWAYDEPEIELSTETKIDLGLMNIDSSSWRYVSKTKEDALAHEYLLLEKYYEHVQEQLKKFNERYDRDIKQFEDERDEVIRQAHETFKEEEENLKQEYFSDIANYKEVLKDKGMKVIVRALKLQKIV